MWGSTEKETWLDWALPLGVALIVVSFIVGLVGYAIYMDYKTGVTRDSLYQQYDHLWQEDFNKDGVISDRELVSARIFFLKQFGWTTDENWRTFDNNRKVGRKEFDEKVAEHYNLK